MKITIVDTLYEEFVDIINQIDEKEITLRITAENNFRKSLLLATASYFETRITESLLCLVPFSMEKKSLIEEFVRNKAISRQYYTFFDWEAKNANKFFALFGSDFKSYMLDRLKDEPMICDAIKAFLEIGNERNRLVHNNFGKFLLEKDAKEIYELYVEARIFVEGLSHFFSDFLKHETLAS